MLLHDKTAVVTGGSRGIGKATIENFFKAGASGVVVADVLEEEGRKTCEEMEKTFGQRCVFVKTNVTNSNHVKEVFRKTMQEFGKVDILVNSAGIVSRTPLVDITEQEWDRMIDINLKGTFLCSKEALLLMQEAKYGKIVNITSVAGQWGGQAASAGYVASKGGIISLTMCFAKNGGPYNINVNAVSPGYVWTEMTKGFTNFDPNVVPLRRIAEAKDIANVIEFLCTEKSSYMTGAILNVNGGIFMTS
jgi:3-oxoacyl-[acyl-carrier protein] reductase